MKEHNDPSRPVSRRGFLKLLAVALGAGVGSPLLAACAKGNNGLFEVDIVLEQNEIHYSPMTLTIPRGTTVIWLNKSYYSQSATCDPQKATQGTMVSLPENAQPWDSGLLYPGQRFSKLFDVPGTYIYFALPRLSAGSIGTIVVE
ncbi:MAG: plastocyanin/azurin family copper-binding protein [Bacteroidota bacterium]